MCTLVFIRRNLLLPIIICVEARAKVTHDRYINAFNAEFFQYESRAVQRAVSGARRDIKAIAILSRPESVVILGGGFDEDEEEEEEEEE
jgi:hypothetical protein